MARWSFGYRCTSDDTKAGFAADPGRIKVLALIVFFILAICISTGAIGPKTIGFRYWEDPGAFADGINGVAETFVVAGTLYAGTEM